METHQSQGGSAEKSADAPGLVDQAKNLGKDIQGKAADLTDTVTRAAKEHAGQIGTAAKDLAADASGRVSSALNEQKSAGADYLGTIASAVQRAAGEFESDVPQAAQYIRQAAGQIETVADAVRQRDMRELLGEVQQFARRQPTLFFGGAVILGFAALRFFKSAAPNAAAAAQTAGSQPNHSPAMGGQISSSQPQSS